MKRITPLNRHVTIKPDKKPEATASGILLVEELGDYAPTGTVIDSSDDTVKPGDTVVYSPYAAVDFDDELYIVSIDNIYGIVTHEG